MASSYSTSLKIQLMGNGEDSGVWGSITNTNWNLMEQAVSGVQTITMANANYTLTNLNGVSDEARNMVLVVQGTNSAIYQIIIPLNQPKMYVVSNQTTGGYAITIGSSTGAIVTIPNGVTAQVYTDGTNTYSAQTGSAGNFTVNGSLTSTGLTDTGNMTVGGTLGVTGATALNGGGTSTTPVSSDNSNNIATTAFVKNVTGTLGTMSTQNSNNVNITGGTINGVSGTASGLTVGNATNATNATTATTATTAINATNATNASNATSGSALASGTAKAWVSFNASGTILKAFNVSSVDVRGTGQWTINFTSSLADGNYVMAGNCAYGPTYPNSGGVLVSFNWDGSSGTPPTASSCQINTTRLTYTGGDAVYFSPALTTVVFFD
jgi:predicted  nucleic acid-binding Zn-ribbon protein